MVGTRKTMSVLGAALAAGGLVLAGPAVAAPAEVTAASTVSGGNVVVTLTNDTAQNISCTVEGFLDPKKPEIGWDEPMGDFYQRSQEVAAGGTETLEFTPEAGTYRVYWTCLSGTGDEEKFWGTSARLPADQATAQPAKVVVPAAGEETEVCFFGSVCIPM